MSKIAPYSPMYFCDKDCLGHPAMPNCSLPSSQDKFFSIIRGDNGFIFEDLNTCILLVKDAPINGNRIGTLNNFCIQVHETVMIIVRKMVGFDLTIQVAPDCRLAYFYIANQIRTLTKIHSNLVKSSYAEALDEAHIYCLSYNNRDYRLLPGFNCGIRFNNFCNIDSNNFCNIAGLNKFYRHLSEEQRMAIMFPKNASSIPCSITLAEPMFRSLVSTMYAPERIFEICFEVPEIAQMPPGILSIIISYVPNRLQDI